MSIRIDDIDERILYHLAADARHTSAPDIAETLDVSPPTIRNRIRRLEDANVITGYHAHIDYEHVDSRLTNLFLCTTTDVDRERFARRVLAVAGVIGVREVMTGNEDLHVMAVGTDMDDLSRIARDIKALGVDIEEEDLVHREHLQGYAPFGPDHGTPTAPVTSVADLPGDADVVEIRVADSAPIAGRTLQEAGEAQLLDDGVLVITIERDDRTLPPQGETTIRSGDLITVLSRSGLSEETLHTFTND